jgi:hypothetical protein
MDLGTAASIGIDVFKHRNDIKAALGGLSDLSKLSGSGFSKIAGQFGLPTGIGHAIAGAIDNTQSTGNTSGVQAMLAMNYFDADKNGEVSRQELTNGLQHLGDSGLSGQAEYKNLTTFGQRMLQNYDKAATLDGQGGVISYRDLGKLIQRDGNVASLSDADWQSLQA